MKSDTCKTPTCTLFPVIDGYCLKCYGAGKKKVQVIDKFNIHGFKGEMELFLYLWQNREHRCYVSGVKLDKYRDTDFFPNLFAHILPKAKNRYPKFKLYENNLVLLSPDIHTMFDNPTLKGIKEYEEKTGHTFSALFELERILHEEYKKGFISCPPLRKIVIQYQESQKSA